MADRLTIDCSKRAAEQQPLSVPLTSSEQAERDQMATAASADASTTAARQGNATTMRQRAEQALDANRTYLALGTPTAAQTTAQVRLLTQETTALVRLLLGLLDRTD